MSVPAAMALLFEIFPAGAARHRALAVYAAVGAVGFADGLVLGGAVTGAFGWGSIFGAATTVGAGALSVGLLVAFVRWERRLADPLLPVGVLAAGPVRAPPCPARCSSSR